MTDKTPEQPEGQTAPENPTEAKDSRDVDRREFLATTAAVGGAMVLGFWLPPSAEAASVPVAAQPWYREATVPEINAWITIAPDDTVTIRVGQTELGTGVFTANPMMVAEELQCDWKKVRAEYASANRDRSEEHTSELQSRLHLVCRLLLEKKKRRSSRAPFTGCQY